MIRSVDLVVDGDGSAVCAAAAGVLRRRQCALVVLRAGDRRTARRCRRRFCKAANADLARVTVRTHAEVVCVDGVGGVGAVVIRDTRTGRLSAVNTPAFVSSAGHVVDMQAR